MGQFWRQGHNTFLYFIADAAAKKLERLSFCLKLYNPIESALAFAFQMFAER
jgi:hypothetical protein